MQWGILIPVAAIIAGPVSWMFTTWVRARHGYPVDNEQGELIGRDGNLTAHRKAELLSAENQRLTAQVCRLEERIAVLERIATDPATRLTAEIETLRTARKEAA